MDQWTREQTILLMEFLRENEFIWNYRGEEHMNLPKKNRVLQGFVEQIQHLRPNLTVSDLKKKLKSLRDQYHKEHIKVLNSTKSGSGTDDIYVPALWNYDELHQLFSRTEARDECPQFDDDASSGAEELTPRRQRKTRGSQDMKLQVLQKYFQRNESGKYKHFFSTLTEQLDLIYKESLRVKVQMEITCFLNAKVDELYKSGALTYSECEDRLRSQRSSAGAPFEMGASTSRAHAGTCTNPSPHGSMGPTSKTSGSATTAVGLGTSSKLSPHGSMGLSSKTSAIATTAVGLGTSSKLSPHGSMGPTSKTSGSATTAVGLGTSSKLSPHGSMGPTSKTSAIATTAVGLGTSSCPNILRRKHGSMGLSSKTSAIATTAVGHGISSRSSPHGSMGPTSKTSAIATTAVGHGISSRSSPHGSMGPTEVKVLDELRFNIKPSKSKILEKAMEGLFDSDD